jgi:hypothetical protein
MKIDCCEAKPNSMWLGKWWRDQPRWLGQGTKHMWCFAKVK